MGSSYLDTLSSNTRYQIRRSRRIYEERGQVELKRAQSVGEALEFFDQIGPLHIHRWGGELGESGFVNPEFLLFHRNF